MIHICSVALCGLSKISTF